MSAQPGTISEDGSIAGKLLSDIEETLLELFERLYSFLSSATF